MSRVRLAAKAVFPQVQAAKAVFPQVGGVPLKQSEKFNYLGLSFASDGKQNSKLSNKQEQCRQCASNTICDTKTWALHQGKAIHFQISPCSDSNLWP